MIAQPVSNRQGTSLLEVILALSILLGSVAALGTLLDSSNRQAEEMEERSLGMQLCQSKMAEIAAGIEPMDSQSNAPFEEFEAPEGWEWSVEVEDAEFLGLYKVTVMVQNMNSFVGSPEITLSQMVLDPTARGTNLDEAKIAGEEETEEGTEEQPSGGN